MMQLPLAYLDNAAIEEVPIDLWRELFEATGWPESLKSKHASFGHQDVIDSLRSDDPTDGLLQALEALHDLGTEAGHDAIVAALTGRRVSMDSLPKETGEREFALRLYLAQRSDASLADVFVRAQTQVQESGEQRRYNEFMGKKARQVSNLSAIKTKLHEEVLRYCQESDLGEHVEVQAFDDDGTIVFNVVRSHRTKKPLAVVPGRTARAPIQFRPVHCDLLRYESSLGRLRIAARTASMVDFYKNALGKVLFEDAFFFTGKPICSLRVLQERGRQALDGHDVIGVGRIRMTECLWERGDRNLVQIRSGDCFSSIEELRLPLIEGDLVQAKLKIDLIATSTRPVTVTIRVPSRIEISQKRHEHLVERVLDAIGIRNSAAPAGKKGVWSLHPWRHPLTTWRSLFGAETDKLIQAGVLKATQLTTVTHPEHPDAGRALRSHSLAEGNRYGVSEVSEVPSRELSATDIDGWELHPENFGKYLRRSLGITNSGNCWDGQELLDLGTIEIGDKHIHFAYALRQPTAGIGARLRALALGTSPVLLVPETYPDGSELAKVMLDSALPRLSRVVRGAVNACGLADSVPAIHIAPDGARLVVDTVFQKVWIDGTEITGLVPDGHPFKFIELLARNPARVSSDDITKILSPARQDGNTPARQAKNAAKKAITDARTKAGQATEEDPFPSAGNGYYRCVLPPYVR